MPRGAPSPKISISIAPSVHTRLVEAAEAEGVTVSAWITRAAEDRLAIIDGLALVAQWEAQHGAFTVDELARADERVRADLDPNRHGGRDDRRL
ncbi:MAG: hypothetical protein ABJH68_16205 [Ilumatobacter sp.]|uniref:hypothetical protein n=1 Tax=Ilumatobacter sp. TaxID=1967498 RepID=UPI0032987699